MMNFTIQKMVGTAMDLLLQPWGTTSKASLWNLDFDGMPLRFSLIAFQENWQAQVVIGLLTFCALLYCIHFFCKKWFLIYFYGASILSLLTILFLTTLAPQWMDEFVAEGLDARAMLTACLWILIFLFLLFVHRLTQFSKQMLQLQSKLIQEQQVLEKKLSENQSALEQYHLQFQQTLQTLNSVDSQLTETENKLRLAEIAAKNAIDAQKQFIAMASHEIRTPLAIIDNANQLLERKIPFKSDTASIIARVKRAVSGLSTLLENLLTQDRLLIYNPPLNFTSVSLRDLSNSVVDYTRLISDQYALEIELDETIDLVKADPDLLRILLFNLISNAVKYSPAGQPVRLKIYKSREYFKIEVIDQGFGVEPEELPFIFKAYARGRLAHHVPGTGLGLSLAQRIAQLHGGDIELKSQKGVGTQVVVSWIDKTI